MLNNCFRARHILLILLALFFQGCDVGSDLCESEIVDSLSSENDGVKILVLRKNCGATTSYVYSVYLLEGKKTELEEENLIFRADKVEHLKVHWLSDTNIEISVDSARVQQFKNYYWKNVSSIGYDEIKIKFIEWSSSDGK